MKRQNTILSSNDQSLSVQRHHHEKNWQILLPLFIGIILMLAAGVFVVLTASGSSAGGPVSQWADISAIWLILPVIMFLLIGNVVLIGFIYLIGKLIKGIPIYANLVQQYAGLIAAKTYLATHKMVSPIISVSSVKAGFSGFLSSLLGRKHPST